MSDVVRHGEPPATSTLRGLRAPPLARCQSVAKLVELFGEAQSEIPRGDCRRVVWTLAWEGASVSLPSCTHNRNDEAHVTARTKEARKRVEKAGLQPARRLACATENNRSRLGVALTRNVG